ncbi:HEPN domain-containing protein [Candidatus Woesearchaeota archaeon]|nr:HEPN domain-containing protein [Candidatus Woesearchaeota archaeon]
MQFQKEIYNEKFKKLLKEDLIVNSNAQFKIKLFLKKAENSYLIANHHKTQKENPEQIYWWQWAITISYYSMLYAAKAAILQKGYEVKTHEAAEVALGHLLVPNKLELEDLELLNQTHKAFEEEYITYFQDARIESSTSRYQARPSYTEKRVTEILKNAKKFINKIDKILE